VILVRKLYRLLQVPLLFRLHMLLRSSPHDAPRFGQEELAKLLHQGPYDTYLIAAFFCYVQTFLKPSGLHTNVSIVSPNFPPESSKLISVFLYSQVLVDAGLKRPQDASKFGQEELAELLQEGGYTHYMTQTAQRLKQAAEEIAGSPHKTVADLRDIEDPKALEKELQKLHGAGPSTAILFLRWVAFWVKGNPSVSFWG
jgi:hypothetical protein